MFVRRSPSSAKGHRQWLRARNFPSNWDFIRDVRYDLELRRRFLEDGTLADDEMQFVLEYVPHAYNTNTFHFLALARLARNSYNEEEVSWILFCISRN